MRRLLLIPLALLFGAGCSAATDTTGTHGRNASGMTAYCVDESRALGERVAADYGVDIPFNEETARQDCANRDFDTKGEVDVFINTIEDAIVTLAEELEGWESS